METSFLPVNAAHPCRAAASAFTGFRAAALRPLFVAAALVLAALPLARGQTTATPTTFYSFSDATDGSTSESALIVGRDGNFYGTTSSGGANNKGTVFRLTTEGKLTTLHHFAGGSDGENCKAPLVQGSDGNFYGTTAEEIATDPHSRGTVFRITSEGTLTTLYRFGGGSDGNNPETGLVEGRDGNFYGTTREGGMDLVGTVFRITPEGTLTTLLSFARSNGTAPYSGLVEGRDGNFYGTTYIGGGGPGTVFRITPGGMLTTLHYFGATDGDGIYPAAGLVLGRDGAFYGTTQSGGAHYTDDGTVFRITSEGTLTTLHSFSRLDGNAFPSRANLVQGRDGSFYGTTEYGGPKDKGTVYRITPAGALTTLYSFPYSSGGPEGENPAAAMVQGSDGSLYGTTREGGVHGDGTVYRLTVPTEGLPPSSPGFFAGEAALGGGAYYLAFAKGNPFGYYSFLDDPAYLYHYDLGYEYVFDAADGKAGVYLYDFASNTFFYTSPTFPYPYLYDFTLNTVVYYYPNPTDPTHYNTNGIRYFVRLDTGAIFSK